MLHIHFGTGRLGLYERFMPNVNSATLVAHGKPEPDVFLFSAGWMKTSPMRCLVVEDSVPGVKAVVRAGMAVVGFTGGAHCGPDHSKLLLKAGAALDLLAYVGAAESGRRQPRVGRAELRVQVCNTAGPSTQGTSRSTLTAATPQRSRGQATELRDSASETKVRRRSYKLNVRNSPGVEQVRRIRVHYGRRRSSIEPLAHRG